MKRALQIFVGSVLGLVLAEVAFHVRDGGAFPHVNFYVADDALGAKLRPNATMKMSFSGNPVSTIHTNARGFRGGEWTAPVDVLVVGDSQVFGLGVNDEETFSAVLAKELGQSVANAGVPTYGPGEYTALVASLAPELKPKTVVYVLNVANDLFELERPNRDRHVIWDGWAVRKEMAPTSVTAFPFRAWLMSQSHAVYAARRLLNAPLNARLASEGSWRDLTVAASTTPPPDKDELKKRLQARVDLGAKIRSVDAQFRDRFASESLENEAYERVAKKIARYDGEINDIVGTNDAESGSTVDETAQQLFFAALAMQKNDALLAATVKNDPNLTKLLDERRALRQQLGEVLANGTTKKTPLRELLERTKVAAGGARVLVVALPLDVQVSMDEWKKYDKAPADMAPTQVLLDTIVFEAEAAGVEGLDAIGALRAAEPGAFMYGDLHMSAQGHAALGKRIAEVLRALPPKRGELPPGRSLFPLEAEWDAIDEVSVKGSTAAGCETKMVREWLRVRCAYESRGDVAIGVELQEGGHGDGIVAEGSGLTLVLPLLEGDTARARFTWQRHTQDLLITWPKQGALQMAFDKVVTLKKAAPFHSGHGPKPLAARAWNDGLRPLDCHDVSCSLGRPTFAPTCASNEMRFGVLGRCVPTCTDSCATGTCTEWNGKRGCALP